MQICINTNKSVAVKTPRKNPWILEETKKEVCGNCDYWRGVCVININAALGTFSESDAACGCFKPRKSKTVPLAFPGRR